MIRQGRKPLFFSNFGEPMNNAYPKLNQKSAELIIIFFVSLCFILIFSISTSILNPYLYCFDSAIFQTAGYLWTSGKLPYRDFFDHKGPLIFLINAIAYSFPYPRLALVIMQTLSLSLVLLLNHRLLIRYTSFKTSLASLAVFLCYLSFILNSGNLTEEYSLPLIALPEFLEIPWLIEQSDSKNKYSTHPPVFALLLAVYPVGNSRLC